MILIHQRKSAGTSLIYTLSEALQVSIENNNQTKITPYSKSRHSDLKKHESVDESIISIHLHPTESNFNWVVTEQVKCVILLRNPKESYKALSRHREIDNTFIKANGAVNFENSEEVLIEFYENWGSLRGLDNILVVYFEELVSSPNKVLDDIFKFYGKDKLIGEVNCLKKKRYTGVGSREIENSVIPPYPYKDKIQFLHDPDHKSTADIFMIRSRYLFISLKRLIKKYIL